MTYMKKRTLYFVIPFLATLFLACNSTSPNTQTERSTPTPLLDPIDSAETKTTKLFVAATAEYTKEFYKKGKPDTLFLSRNPDFPNITLPDLISEIPIRVINTDEGHAIAKRRPMTILNLIDLGGNEFMIVNFKNGFDPQFNCQLYFRFTNNEYKLDSLRTTYPYEKTRTRSH